MSKEASAPHFESDTLVWRGDEIKALGDGRFAGYLVRFGTPDQTDFVGDFFTKDTDFGLDDDGEGTTDILYEHGLDPMFGKARLGKGKLKKDDVGVWVEAQLELRRAYEGAVAEKYGKALGDLIAAKALGLSSGVPGHLVDREPIGRASWLKTWRLGLDASLTTQPCEPRTLAVPLKSLAAAASATPAPAAAAVDSFERLSDVLKMHVYGVLADAETPADARPAELARIFAAHAPMAVNALVSLANGDDEAAARSLCRDYLARSLSGLALCDHADAVLDAAKALSDRFADVEALRSRQGRRLSDARRGQVKALSDALAGVHDRSAPPPTVDHSARLKLIALRHRAAR